MFLHALPGTTQQYSICPKCPNKSRPTSSSRRASTTARSSSRPPPPSSVPTAIQQIERKHPARASPNQHLRQQTHPWLAQPEHADPASPHLTVRTHQSSVPTQNPVWVKTQLIQQPPEQFLAPTRQQWWAMAVSITVRLRASNASNVANSHPDYHGEPNPQIPSNRLNPADAIWPIHAINTEQSNWAKI
ncbi:hypothetical protein ACLOJK_026782 [Asimina triloba]